MPVYRASSRRWPIPVVTITIPVIHVCGLSHQQKPVLNTNIRRSCMTMENYEVLQYTSIIHVSQHTRGETISEVMLNPFCVQSSQVRVLWHTTAFHLLLSRLDCCTRSSFLLSYTYLQPFSILSGAHFIAPVLFDPTSPPSNTSLAFYQGLPMVIHHEQVD